MPYKDLQDYKDYIKRYYADTKKREHRRAYKKQYDKKHPRGKALGVDARERVGK